MQPIPAVAGGPSRLIGARPGAGAGHGHPERLQRSSRRAAWSWPSRSWCGTSPSSAPATLLDLLTDDELSALVHAGEIWSWSRALRHRSRPLSPADPLDAHVAAAFDAHQRRMTPRGRLLGPDAVDAAVKGFRGLGPRSSSGRARGGSALPRPAWPSSGSPDGSVRRASTSPGSRPTPSLYRRRRLREAAAGRLAVTVGHADLLVLP